jgi:hypothetical protein
MEKSPEPVTVQVPAPALVQVHGNSWVAGWLDALGLKDKYLSLFLEKGYDNSLVRVEVV